MRTSLYYLRIVFSAFCGLTCVLLIVFWVRSYNQWDSPYALIRDYELQANSLRGYLYIGYKLEPGFPADWQWHTYGASHFTAEGAASESVTWTFDSQVGALGFGTMATDGYRFIYCPYWFLVFVSAALTASNWIRWRFSLRTLLIATTFVAAVLGLAVYIVRQ